MRQLKWGIIGCADIARRRAAAAIRENPRCRLRSILSRDAGRARQFAEEQQVECPYSDLAAFLADSELDAVYVASELYRHADETVAAAEAGKHVLCEKPMAMNREECARMVAACERNGVRLAVAYYRRYYPKAQKMKELIDAGAIGRPVAGHTSLSADFVPAADDPKRWRVDPRQSGGGALMDVGSHYLDLMCHFLGEPRDAQGAADRLVHDYESPDSESFLARFAAGAQVTGHFNWNVPGTLNDFAIHGTDGALLAGPFDGPELTLCGGGETTSFDLPRPANTHAPLFADFTDRTLAGEPPQFDGRAGALATAVIQAVYESNAAGRRIPVSLPA